MSPSGDGAAETTQTLDVQELNAVLGADLFADIPRSSLESVLPRCHVIEIEADNTLIERGLKNEYIFMVLRGSLRVHLDDGQMPHQVLLGPGECVGEISVIDGRGATATVVTAAHDAIAAHRPRDAVVPDRLDAIRGPQSAAHLLRSRAARQRLAPRQPRTTPRIGTHGHRRRTDRAAQPPLVG